MKEHMRKYTRKQTTSVLGILLIGVTIGGILAVLWSNSIEQSTIIYNYDDKLDLEIITAFPTTAFVSETLIGSFNVTEVLSIGVFRFYIALNTSIGMTTPSEVYVGYKITDSADTMIKQELTPQNWFAVVSNSLQYSIGDIDTNLNDWVKVEIYLEIRSSFSQTGTPMSIACWVESN